jgi:hypothetical protein
MKEMKEMNEMKEMTFFILLLISALLISCSNDSEEIKEPENALGMVSFTRGDTPFTVTDDYSPVGVFLVDGDGTSPTQKGRFIYKANEVPPIWRSSIEVTATHNYAIYGYAPADAVTATISNESLTGATLTFSNLPAVSSQDICFVVGVQQLTTVSDAKDIPLGQFTFTGKPQNENFVNLLMDHVYAAVCLQMSIGAEYAQLRSIKIRKLELQTTKATATATVKLVSQPAGNSPVQSATYSNLTGTQSSATFFDSTDGVELDATTLTEATCCFVPDLDNELMLVTTYDVYDRNGNKISERTATNDLPPLNVARGQRVTLSLTIEPTYLYVLSDPDLDNPTITVN